MRDELIKDLKIVPWKLFRRDSTDVDDLLKDTINCVGAPLITSRLRPHESADSRINSLSSRYGLGRFPLHTDFSTYIRPPRFILFLARKPRNTKTLVCNANKIAAEFGMPEILSSVFVIQKQFPHYCRMIEGINPDKFYRFNSDVMIPKNKCALRISNFIADSLKPDVSIDWQENCGALVFNWHALHGRAVVSNSSGEQLERYAFY